MYRYYIKVLTDTPTTSEGIRDKAMLENAFATNPNLRRYFKRVSIPEMFGAVFETHVIESEKGCTFEYIRHRFPATLPGKVEFVQWYMERVPTTAEELISEDKAA